MCKQPESLRCVKLALSRKSACLLRRQSSLSKYICETRIALNTDHNVRKMLVAEFRRVDMSAIFGELINKLGDYQIQIVTTGKRLHLILSFKQSTSRFLLTLLPPQQ